MSIGKYLAGFHYRNSRKHEGDRLFFLRETDHTGIKILTLLNRILQQVDGLETFGLAILYEYIASPEALISLSAGAISSAALLDDDARNNDIFSSLSLHSFFNTPAQNTKKFFAPQAVYFQ